jgi:hypothetical protein
VFTNDGPDEYGVTVMCADPKENRWTVDFFPGGTIGLELHFQGSSDSRATRMLKAIGAIHRK